jgi:hypothetical protein
VKRSGGKRKRSASGDQESTPEKGPEAKRPKRKAGDRAGDRAQTERQRQRGERRHRRTRDQDREANAHAHDGDREANAHRQTHDRDTQGRHQILPIHSLWFDSICRQPIRAQWERERRATQEAECRTHMTETERRMHTGKRTTERRTRTEANAQRRGGRAQANTWGGNTRRRHRSFKFTRCGSTVLSTTSDGAAVRPEETAVLHSWVLQASRRERIEGARTPGQQR